MSRVDAGSGGRWRDPAAPLATLRADLGVLRRGIGLILAAAPATAAAVGVLVLVQNLLPVAQVWLTKAVVDALVAVAAPASAPGTAQSADPSRLLPVLLPAVLYAVTLLAPLVGPLEFALVLLLQDRAGAEIDRRLIGAGTRLVDLFHLERPAFHEEFSLLNQAASVPRDFLAFVRQGVASLITGSGVLLLLAGLHPLIPLALVAAGVPRAVVAQRVQQLVDDAWRRRSRVALEAAYSIDLASDPAAAKEVRVFGLGDFLLRRFLERSRATVGEIDQLQRHALWRFVAVGGLEGAVLLGGLWYVAAQLGAGRLGLGDLALYLAAVARLYQHLVDFTVSFGSSYRAFLALRRLFTFLDEARPVIALPPAGRGLQAPLSLRQGIILRHVRFRYPEGTQDVLRDVSAILPAGQVTALVGANGAGKSTLVKLLTRMYDPTAGQLLLDGQPLPAYDLHSLRRRTAVVYQDFAHFAITMRENIAVGAFAAGEQGTQDVERAARLAGAEEVAARLPRGYDTELTRNYGGVELSGGEWQTVALARGFVRDAALIILDEPSSALDAAAEARLFQQFRALAAGKTALVISHRLSTVRTADHILVLHDGRVTEAGSHEALLARAGHYATLFEMQAGRYR
jgi:ATP-binding cassette subfamily B protein